MEKIHEHDPVLVGEVVRLLDPRPGQTIVDGTVGLGGHAAALLPRIQPGGCYVGLDADDAMLAEARVRLRPPADLQLHLEQANYTDFPEVLARLGIVGADHVVLDLGVNSAQLEDPLRGFSFTQDGPLDMRYDRRGERRAVDLVNGLSERELADLFYEFGQEGNSRKIAKRICQMRHTARITTTRSLARAIESAFTPTGGAVQRGRIHAATRSFQALRVAVNDELGNLRRCLEQVLHHLRPRGRLAVISFHSLEDGIVKNFIRMGVSDGALRDLTKRPVVADPSERSANPRSRSAKLRVAERQ